MIKKYKKFNPTSGFIKTKHTNYRARGGEFVKLVNSNMYKLMGGKNYKYKYVKAQEKLNSWGTKTPNMRASKQDYK